MSKRIIDLMNVKDQGDNEIGIEIEMEGKNLIQGNFGPWNFHTDNSLRGESAEYVLRKPIVRGRVREVLETAQKELKNAGSKLSPSDRCGVHVHVNCQKLTVAQVFNFALLYLALEDMMVHFCGADREGNLFCLRAKDAEYLIVGLIAAAKSHDLYTLQTDQYRYASLNMSALAKYGSLEFRPLRTPKEFSIIETWVNLLLCIKDKSMKYKNPVELVEDISKQGPEDFVMQTFGPLADLLWYDEYADELMASARRIQRVAYQYKEPTPVVEDNKPVPRRQNVVFEQRINGLTQLDKIRLEVFWRYEGIEPSQFRLVPGGIPQSRQSNTDRAAAALRNILDDTGAVFDRQFNVRPRFVPEPRNDLNRGARPMGAPRVNFGNREVRVPEFLED